MDLQDQPDDFDQRYPPQRASAETLSGTEPRILSAEGADKIDRELRMREGQARKSFTLAARAAGGVDAALEAFVSLFRMVQSVVHANNISKGWWKERMVQVDRPGDCGHGIQPNPKDIPGLLMLVNSELCEALEAQRNHNPLDKHLPTRNSLEVELADAVIRIMDIGEAYGLDVAGALIDKAKFNESRPHRHGGKAC